MTWHMAHDSCIRIALRLMKIRAPYPRAKGLLVDFV